jgi:hypothetical protein
MLIFIFTLELAYSCPAVVCQNTSTVSNCMEYNSKTSSYSMQACSLANYTCPNPVHMSKSYALVCEYWIDSRYWVSSSWSQYYQYAILEKNSNCDPYGLVSVCDSSKGLVCYCPFGTCYCTDGLKYGDDCYTNPVPCMSGYTCSNKICTLMYSVPPGSRATNSLACQGGGPLVVSSGSFVCRKGPQSLGGIPKMCKVDNDCVSDTGNEITSCLCGLNTDGQGYCQLHFGDLPMVNWRQAQRDGNYKQQIYWEFISLNYPYLQGNLPQCLGDVWRDFYQYKQQEVGSTTSFSVFISIISYCFII